MDYARHSILQNKMQAYKTKSAVSKENFRE